MYRTTITFYKCFPEGESIVFVAVFFLPATKVSEKAGMYFGQSEKKNGSEIVLNKLLSILVYFSGSSCP